MKKSMNPSAICILSHSEICDVYNHPTKYDFKIIQMEYAYGPYFIVEVVHKKNGDDDQNV